MKIGNQPAPNLRRTHEPTGVTVEFIKLGFVAKTRLVGTVGNGIGAICTELMKPGVGVRKWEGVQREIKVGENDKNPNVVNVDYSLESLDEVVACDKSFGGWFNDNLLEINGFQSDEEDDIEGKSEAPSSSSEAETTQTVAK